MRLPCVSMALFSLFACKGDGDQKKPPEPAKTVVEAPVPVTKTHSGGMERFQDPGVYVDGVPLGVLRFGELPVPLAPVWVPEEAAVPFGPDEGPRTKLVKQRRYRFSDYLTGIGVDVSKIKELHIYGGNQYAAAVVIPGKNIDMDGFLFRFGGSIWGKPLPACPPDVGDGKCPDQIGSIAVYVDKQPPQRQGGYFYFDGEKIEGIPYFGDPIRNGVRVYLDGPLATTVKRNKLRAANIKPLSTTETSETYKFFDFLKSQGVDTDTIVEAWLIQYERHIEKLTREQLLELTFEASQGESGAILVGDKKTEAHAITLHTKPVAPEDLPQLTTEEIEKADG